MYSFVTRYKKAHPSLRESSRNDGRDVSKRCGTLAGSYGEETSRWKPRGRPRADVVRRQPERNLKKAIARIGDAAKRGATIVCLQELFRSQYFCQKEDAALFALAESIPGPTTEALARAARQHKVVLVELAVRAARAPASTTTRPSSSSATDRIAGKYRKMHIPDDPLYYEKFYFTPGDLGFQYASTLGRPAPACSSAGTSGSRKPRG